MKLSKKFLVASCAVIMIALVSFLSACGETSNAGGDGAAKEYSIATDTTFAPFEFTNDKGEFVGIDMEILAAIAEDQGFTYTVNSLGFDAACQAVSSGQADGVIAGMSINDVRKETFDFSDPYFDSGVVMGIAANSSIKSYDDLEGLKVAVKIATEGETFANSIKDEYGFETVAFKESSMMYEDVLTGNSQACFEDYPVLGYAVSQNVGLKIVTEKERGSSYGFAVNKGQNPELLKMFNAGLANIKASGKYQEILDKYIVSGS